jgi:hypothetical protein
MLSVRPLLSKYFNSFLRPNHIDPEQRKNSAFTPMDNSLNPY